MHNEELSYLFQIIKDPSILSEILSKQTSEQKEATIFSLINNYDDSFLSQFLTPDDVTQYRSNLSSYYSDKDIQTHDFLALHELTHQLYLSFKKPTVFYYSPSMGLGGKSTSDEHLYQMQMFQKIEKNINNMNTDSRIDEYSKPADIVNDILKLREKNTSVISTVENKPK